MAKLNVIKTIEGTKGKINRKYDMTYNDMEVIYKYSGGAFDMICNSFMLGYAQGVKAAKAETRSAK